MIYILPSKTKLQVAIPNTLVLARKRAATKDILPAQRNMDRQRHITTFHRRHDDGHVPFIIYRSIQRNVVVMYLQK